MPPNGDCEVGQGLTWKVLLRVMKEEAKRHTRIRVIAHPFTGHSSGFGSSSNKVSFNCFNQRGYGRTGALGVSLGWMSLERERHRGIWRIWCSPPCYSHPLVCLTLRLSAPTWGLAFWWQSPVLPCFVTDRDLVLWEASGGGEGQRCWASGQKGYEKGKGCWGGLLHSLEAMSARLQIWSARQGTAICSIVVHSREPAWHLCSGWIQGRCTGAFLPPCLFLLLSKFKQHF